MEAKDGSAGFDFDGIYNEIQPQDRILYTLAEFRNCWTHRNKFRFLN
ncbi:MAG: hypothetical protein LC658_05460 [Bacteroidales bacterium]|nr:hypothetical protein [Bacteroidales bacterium]